MLEVSIATHARGKEETQGAHAREEGNGKEKDQLEAAFSFFFFTQGIRLHQRAESQRSLSANGSFRLIRSPGEC